MNEPSPAVTRGNPGRHRGDPGGVRETAESPMTVPLSGYRLLVAYANNSTFTVTTSQYLNAFRDFSAADVHYLHVTQDARPVVDLDRYDAVLISYCARLCIPRYVSEGFLRLMDGYQGVRAIAIQDEYEAVEAERKGLDRLRPHVVFTCVPPDQREAVYPSSRYPSTAFVQVLTGYAPHQLPMRHATRPLSTRPVHLGYRGRDIGPRYGRLAVMKAEIGNMVGAAAARRGLACDIAIDEASRIYGDAWYEWLGNCRCVLGSESGSNIFDFDGSIAEGCAKFGRDRLPQALRNRIDELDRSFAMGQASPRIFEAAAMGTAMALYRGRYSGILKPDRHYIPIELDHSNLDEVLDRVQDTEHLDAMVDRTRADLIDSGRYSYAAFVRVVQNALAEALRGRLPRGGAAPVQPAITRLSDPPLDEMPTSEPRHFDSFQLRHLLKQLETRPRSAAAAFLRRLKRSKPSRIQRLIDTVRGKKRP